MSDDINPGLVKAMMDRSNQKNVHSLKAGDMLIHQESGYTAKIVLVNEEPWSTPIKRQLDSIIIKTSTNETFAAAPHELISLGWSALLVTTLYDIDS